MGANADVVRSFWEAFGRRDIDGATAHADEGAEIVVPKTVHWGGTYRGPGGFVDRSPPVLTPQAAAFCSDSWASSQVWRTSFGVR